MHYLLGYTTKVRGIWTNHTQDISKAQSYEYEGNNEIFEAEADEKKKRIIG